MYQGALLDSINGRDYSGTVVLGVTGRDSGQGRRIFPLFIVPVGDSLSEVS